MSVKETIEEIKALSPGHSWIQVLGEFQPITPIDLRELADAYLELVPAPGEGKAVKLNDDYTFEIVETSTERE